MHEYVVFTIRKEVEVDQIKAVTVQVQRLVVIPPTYDEVPLRLVVIV